jgi:flagellin-like hook-associated protein FlgL
LKISLGSNISSLQAQRRLERTSQSLSSVYERLASGVRINRASDDPAGLSISLSLTADSRVYTQARRNISDGISMINIADGALAELANIVTRQIELAEQAANGVYSVVQRRALNSEANALSDEFNRIVATTKFNNRAILDATNSADTAIQVGYGNQGIITFNATSLLDRAVGTGTFAAETTYAAAYGADIELADFNRDGHVDIMSSSGRLLLGNGNGSFTAPSIIVNTSGNGHTDSADFNGDGVLDVIFSLGGASTVANIAIGRGDGTFLAATTITVGATSRKIAIGDYNNDGKLDLASLDSASNSFNIMLGNGNGTFYSPVTYSTGTGAGGFGLTTGDVNSDGILDIVSGMNGGTMAVSLGNSNGTFRNATHYINASGSADVVTLKDINSDGFLDIIGSNFSVNGFNTLLGNGDGSFRAGGIYQGPAQTVGLIVNDFNNDGIYDVIVANSYAGTDQFGIALGNSDGTFLSTATTTTTYDPYEIEAADLNEDGVLDLVTSNFGAGATSISVFLQNTNQSATVPRLYLLSQESARETLGSLRMTLERIAAQRGGYGAALSRLATANNLLAATIENTHSANSRIIDTDIAADSADLARLNILQSTASAILAQANQSPKLALSLLQS